MPEEINRRELFGLGKKKSEESIEETPEAGKPLKPVRNERGGITRRRLLSLGLVGGAAALVARKLGIGRSTPEQPDTEFDVPAKPKGLDSTTSTTEATVYQPKDVPKFPGVTEQKQLNRAEGWSGDRLQQVIEAAIKSSLETRQEVIIELPLGEIIVNKPITSIIPEGAKIKIKGNENGSRLKLDPSLSAIPKDWGSFAQRSIMYFKDMEGDLAIDGVEFHGGSERAGKGGYKPPLSPWDAMVMIVGKGEGDKYEPAMHRAGQRKGIAVIRNCNFANSESEGALMQNISNAWMDKSQGKNLDVLFNSTWCDYVSGTNLIGENLNSDGVYITSAQNVVLKDMAIKTARQGYDLQGVAKAKLDNCNAYDCLIGYAPSKSETDKITKSGQIEINNSSSVGCQLPFSIGEVMNLNVEGGIHEDVGGWYRGYRVNDFLHKDGIMDPSGVINALISILEYAPPAGSRFKYNNVQMRRSKNAPGGYILTPKVGVANYQ
jgi:hypothetical protein